MGDTLKDLSVLYAKKQPKQVDYITEESPILARIPFEEASHDMFNVYEQLESVSGGAFVEMNGVLPNVSSKSKLERLDLGIMGGISEVGEDTARSFGGAAQYFAKKEAAILKQTGANAEKKIIYDNFLKYALDNGSALKTAATTGKGYSLIAVRFVEGETTGLYSKIGFRQGAMLEATALSGGSVYKDSNGKLVYGLRYKGYFGIQIANPKTVASICNIQSGKLPTETQINDLLAKVRANSKTFLFCSPDVMTLLSGLKINKIQYTNQDKGINTLIMDWNGIPFVTSYNMGEEDFITIS